MDRDCCQKEEKVGQDQLASGGGASLTKELQRRMTSRTGSENAPNDSNASKKSYSVFGREGMKLLYLSILVFEALELETGSMMVTFK